MSNEQRWWHGLHQRVAWWLVAAMFWVAVGVLLDEGVRQWVSGQGYDDDPHVQQIEQLVTDSRGGDE